VISVLLVDDHPFIRMGFRLVLDAEPDIEVVGEAADGAAAVTMCSALRPDVVLMDVRMPGHDAIEATRDIVAAGLPCRVLILTTSDLDDYVYAGLRAGASGFLLKDTQPAVLGPAATSRLVRQFAATQRTELPSSQHAAQIRQALTSREQDVFSRIAAGLSNSEIAASLFLSEGTVKIHVGRILAKLGLRDRVQAVVLASAAPSPGLARLPAGQPVIMLVTWKLVLFGSRPNRFMELTTRWSRTASTPSGKVGSDMNAADCLSIPRYFARTFSTAARSVSAISCPWDRAMVNAFIVPGFCFAHFAVTA
jgi:DNA-binding NarL/FixJ family response regulator